VYADTDLPEALIVRAERISKSARLASQVCQHAPADAFACQLSASRFGASPLSV
jgi:hypothetical protein